MCMYVYVYIYIYIVHLHLNIFSIGYDFFSKGYFSNNALQMRQTVRKIGWKRFMPLTVGVLY